MTFTRKILAFLVPFAALAIVSGCSENDIEIEEKPPNILLIMLDDMGFSDLGAFGGEIETPTLDQLAYSGLRFNQMQNAAKCFPSRAALLSGQYAQSVGLDKRAGSFPPGLNALPARLADAGYNTLMVGKHHGDDNPLSFGFQKYRGLRAGASNHFIPGFPRKGQDKPAQKTPYRPFCFDWFCTESYIPEQDDFYSTDTYTDWAIKLLEDSTSTPNPFFLYLSYQAPHDPLQAWSTDIEKYLEAYTSGYEDIAKRRYEKAMSEGVIDESFPFNDASIMEWDALSESEKSDEAIRMAVYAAMIDRVDQNITRLLKSLEEAGELENTIILVMSDNGSSAEQIFSGGEGQPHIGLKTYHFDEQTLELRRTAPEMGEEKAFGSAYRWTSLGPGWAAVSNSPFHLFKNYSHSGGVVTPLIIHWPDGIDTPGEVRDNSLHFIDIAPTLLELGGGDAADLPGISFAPLFSGDEPTPTRNLYWEFGPSSAIRDDRWKAVGLRRGEFANEDLEWELYDMETDKTETTNAADRYPNELDRLITEHERWVQTTSN